MKILCPLFTAALFAGILHQSVAQNGGPSTPTPVVMWHGMGDSCCFTFSLGKVKKMLEQEIPGVYVRSLKIGNNMVEDYESGYLVHPNRQIINACNQIKNDQSLQNGFHAVGFSQGAQFL